MNLLIAIIAFAGALILLLVGITRTGAWLIERRNPPAGDFADINGARIHYVHVPARPDADLPALVFLHGASSNLKDEMVPLRPLLEGRAELLFVDRPGHGWSGRGKDNETPSRQADTIAALMDRLGIARAIIVGHSFGGAAVAAFALGHPEKTQGLVFLSAATHPWPGGGTSWYYDLAARPVLGRLFVETLTEPAGMARMPAAIACVFAPNAVPPDYQKAASIPLVLRPGAFRANAIDVAGLYEFSKVIQPRYREIAAPTVVISGDADAVVYEEIHSVGLARDIPGAELVWVHNMGHKPEWVASDLVVAAIEKLAGLPRDLQAVARTVEGRIAADRNWPKGCINEPAPDGAFAPG